MKDATMRVNVVLDWIEKYSEVDCRNLTCKYHMVDSARCGLKSISIGKDGKCIDQVSAQLPKPPKGQTYPTGDK